MELEELLEAVSVRETGTFGEEGRFTGESYRIIQPTVSNIVNDKYIQEFGGEILSLIRPSEPHLGIYMGEVKFLSSMALGKLMTAYERAKSDGKNFAIIGAPKGIYELFSITRLDRVFDMYNSLEEYRGVKGPDEVPVSGLSQN